MKDPRSRMLAAVGRILRTQGGRALTSAAVTREAGLSPKGKWVKNHFGSMDNLMAGYLVQTDFWIRLGDTLREINEDELHDAQRVKALVIAVLRAQLDFFFDAREMQELLIWGISRPGNQLKRRFSEARERSADALLDAADRMLSTPGAPFPPLAALLVMASYFLPIHAAGNESTFCELDLSSAEGRQELYDALEYLVNLSLDP